VNGEIILYDVNGENGVAFDGRDDKKIDPIFREK
jgi:hypothetical protein